MDDSNVTTPNCPVGISSQGKWSHIGSSVEYDFGWCKKLFGGPYDNQILSHIIDVSKSKGVFERTINMRPGLGDKSKDFKKIHCIHLKTAAVSLMRPEFPFFYYNAKTRLFELGTVTDKKTQFVVLPEKIRRMRVVFLNVYVDILKSHSIPTDVTITSKSELAAYLKTNQLDWDSGFTVDHLCHNTLCYNWNHHRFTPLALNKARNGCPGPMGGCLHSTTTDKYMECKIPGFHCTLCDTRDFTDAQVQGVVDAADKMKWSTWKVKKLGKNHHQKLNDMLSKLNTPIADLSGTPMVDLPAAPLLRVMSGEYQASKKRKNNKIN